VLLIEAGLTVLVVLIAFLRPTFGSHWFERAERALPFLASRPRLAVVAVGAATLILRVAVLPVEKIPAPSVHDEFSYLLQADTFAHGRLTNPTPAMWEHFETFHVIFQPTYCSKFFPGQALFLTLGKLLFGHPYWGVWLSSGLMCAAVTWMLQGWFPAQWALLGGILAMLRFGVFGYWADSYWGGNVAAIGGALVLGALPRLKSFRLTQDAALMGLGLILLALSRPWEGIVLALPTAVILLAWMMGKDKPPPGISLTRIVLPLTLMLAVTAAWLAYYCWRTTGNPLQPPYSVYENTYATAPYMLWQHLKPQPVYRHTVLRKLEVDQVLVVYRAFRSPVAHMLRIFAFTSFFLGPILILPFLMLPFVLPYGFSLRDISQHVRHLLLILIVFIAGTEMAIFYNPHYSAPVTGLIIALVLFAIQRIRAWNASGLFLSRAIPVACVLVFALRVAAAPLHIPKSRYSTYYWNEFFELHPQGWFPRAAMEANLSKVPGNHLVIVRYKPEHEPFPDWVYNDADIEHARIIWARDMGSADNKALLDYYGDRQAWLLEADENPPRIVRYASSESGAAQPESLERSGLPTHK